MEYVIEKDLQSKNSEEILRAIHRANANTTAGNSKPLVNGVKLEKDVPLISDSEES